MANIGIVTTWFERGAAYVSRAYKEILSENNKVFIYARGGEEYAIGNPSWDLPEVTWGPWFSATRISMFHFYQWLKQNNIEIILFNEQRDMVPVKIAKELGFTVGAYVDFYTKDTISDFLVYDFLLCNTNRHYSVFKAHPCCYYIPWGVDLDVFNSRKNDDRILSDSITFFHSAGMGGVNLRKGTDLLIKAFSKVVSPARLIIHSQVGLEKYGDDIASLLASDRRINFIHKTVPAPGLYYLGDVYVYPTRLEGIGLTICEALSSGLPVVTTDSPPMNEFVIDGINGSLIRVKEQKYRQDNYYWPESFIDVDHLTEIMERYASNRYIVMEQKRNAINLANERLDWNRNSFSINSILSEFAGRGKKCNGVNCTHWFSWIIRHIYLYIDTFYHTRRIDKRSLRFKNQILL